jgi:O-6-methylguanine DNA methyltransferase
MTSPHQKDSVRLAIPTADGEFIAKYSSRGLAELNFPDRVPGATAGSDMDNTTEVSQWHRRAIAAVNAILTGREPAELPPLDLSGGTEFQQRVWATLRKIKPGQTQSYGEIAKAIGQPKAVRAVGGACGANPIPLLVPCHRVLAVNQKIGGFSGGLEWKRRLLAREGIILV